MNRDSGSRSWIVAMFAAFHKPGLSSQTRVFRLLLCLWMLGFYLPRVPYLGELISRAELRESVVWIRLLGDPVLPLWGAQILVVLLIVAAALAAGGLCSRPAIFTLAALHSILYMQDQSSPRAYGTLALACLWMLWLAPHERGQGLRRGDRWPTQLLKLQFSSVYLFAALAKILSSNGVWLDGLAVDRIMRSDAFGHFLLSEFYVQQLGELPWISKLLSWSTIAIEAAISVALWHRRYWLMAAIATIGLHLGIALTMRVSPLFHTLMLLHLVLFIPDRSFLRCVGYLARARSRFSDR